MTRTKSQSRKPEADDLLRTFDLAAPELLRFLLRRVETREDAADALAEVFVVAWRKRRQLPTDPDQLTGWLYGTARLIAQNQQRTSHRAAKLAERLRLELGSSAETVPDHAEQAAEADHVQQALRTLEPENAELIRLVHWEGLTLSTAAIALNIPASTARSRYQAARSKLRQLLTTDLPVAKP